MTSSKPPWPRRYVKDPVTLSKRFDTVRSAYIFCTVGGDLVNES